MQSQMKQRGYFINVLVLPCHSFDLCPHIYIQLLQVTLMEM
jgi:hypothetical protein